MRGVRRVVTPGERFSAWTVVEEATPTTSGDGSREYRTIWVRCICGKEKAVLLANLVKRHSRSCSKPCLQALKRKRITMFRTNAQHIGDGVYASHDGFQIWLQVDRGGYVESVAIEPATFRALLDFARGLGLMKA